ncbi:MAG: NAD+ synthase [Desulfobulbaceae bacterium]|nr:NAD+ synthase [Desulfobulbaceae bacterium]HIJ78277.1 NAD+ synthase [Deltaproteobacteria bacterium]
MKIALIQTNPVIGDFAGNIETISRRLDKAKEKGCALAILPELAISGYPPQDLLERPAFLDDHDRAFDNLVKQTSGIGVLCGLVTRNLEHIGKPLCNSAVLFCDQEIIATSSKRLLPTYDVFDESRYFEPGQQSNTVQFKGLNLGLTICEDIWNDKNIFSRRLYQVDPVGALLAGAKEHVDLLINIAASPFNLGKAEIKREIFANICNKYGLPLIYVNQVGGQDSLIFDGASLAMDQTGKVVARAARFKEDLVVIDTDTWQGDDHSNPKQDNQETADVYRALRLGTSDYLRKCGFSKVIIGLSGGVDSALTATIATHALGQQNVLGVAMPSPYSSPGSIEDAEQLAKNLGIEFRIIPIADIFNKYLDTLAPIFAGQEPDVTEQNIQARIRGNLLMAIANRQGRLVLSTGNKSEMAVGYCTLYGDMSGGLAVISDVPKQLVYELCRYINHKHEIIPWSTIDKPPSAELAPNQKDEDDLPPYPILDQILAAYLEDNLSSREIIAMGFDRQVVEDVLRRIRINEYKRKQAPMGLKVTTKAFGYGRRYPTAERYREGL